MIEPARNRGLAGDLPDLIGRSRLLDIMSRLGAAVLASPAATFECATTPWHTTGTLRDDGHDTLNDLTVAALTGGGIIRRDLRPSFGNRNGKASGPPLTLHITLISDRDRTPLPGHVIYLWHCDTAGRYSLHDVPDANWLRGVGIADNNGRIRFTTIPPGRHDAGPPHMHFEIFPSAFPAISGAPSIHTDRITLPPALCQSAGATTFHTELTVPAVRHMPPPQRHSHRPLPTLP
ncbi:hypothetical protein [Amaricoccus tamworthensis]|uniref:dioxygenase family protein n=1 Tax=Amaricoccus tamworthensis TaxID=57002 RepID=UPI003C7C1254